MHRRAVVICIIFAISLVALSANALAQRLPLVRIGWVRAAAQAAGPVASAKGFDRQFGVQIVMQAFPTAPEAVQSTVIGATEASYGASVPTGPSLILQGAPIQSVMIYASGGNRLAIVTIRATGINTVAGLAGKTVATPLGSDPEMFLIKALQASGVDPDTVRRVNMAYANMPAALITRQIDAAAITEPTLSAFLSQEPTAQVLERGGKYVALAGSLYMSRQFRSAPNDVAYKTYLALARAMQYIRQVGAKSDEIARIIAESTGTTPENAKTSMTGVLFDPRIKPWVWRKHTEEMAFYISLGRLSRPLNRSEFYDLVLQERAMREQPGLFSDLDAYLKANGASGEELATWGP